MGEKRCLEHSYRHWPAMRLIGGTTAFMLLLLGAIANIDIWRQRILLNHSSAYGSSGAQNHAASIDVSAAASRRGHSSSMPLSTPSKTMYQALLANPNLLQAEQELLLEEFEAAPWLLPARTPLLPYAGVHDFDALLRLRSRPAGSYGKAITILLFSKDYAIITQNSIYSLVKHGGVRNYLVATWRREDLEACLDLNLPCADVEGMLVEPLIGTEAARKHDFVAMAWIKPAVVVRALRQGHAVMMVDTDVAYAVKPVWESYVEYLAQNGADGAWQMEQPVNTGHFVLAPTQPALRFAEAWNASSVDNMKRKVTDQKALKELDGSHFVTCRKPCMCYRHKFELLAHDKRDQVAVFAAYLPGFYMYTQSGCTVGGLNWVPEVDPCDWSVMFMHPICAGGSELKEDILRQSGFWFMDTEGCKPRSGSVSQVPVCRPLRWREPEVEARHYSCRSYDLGLVHGKMPRAVQQLSAGLTGERAVRLLFSSRDKDCKPQDPGLQRYRPLSRLL